MRKPSQRCDFAAFCNVVGISRTMARPTCTLSHRTLVCAGRTQNSTKSSLTRRGSDQKKTFYKPLSQTKRFHKLYTIEMANCCRQNCKIDFNAFSKTQQKCKIIEHCCPPFELETFHLRLHGGFMT